MQSEKNKLTRRGVCHKLEYSPYNFTYIHKGKVVTLNFSSKLHLDNFTKLRCKNFAMIYNHIYKRFKFKMDCRLLSDCNLYNKIETRGFYIKYNNKDFLCRHNITLSGDYEMKKNLEEWQETLMISYGD